MSASSIDIDESIFVVCYLEGKGRSLFTTKFIEKDKIVLEYIGELITDTSKIKKREILYENENLGSYIMFITFNGKNACIDATKESVYKARLMNHSTNPNLQLVKKIINGVPRVFFKAKLNIHPDPELVWNYGETRKSVLESLPWLKPERKRKGIFIR